MKRISKILLATVLISAMVFTMIGCGNSDNASNSSPSTAAAGESTAAATTAEPPMVDPAKITGTVNYAVYNWDVENQTKIVETFNKVYPNITVNVIGFEGDLDKYLTTQAASNALPDVVWGWQNVYFPISQGWVYPIDEYLAKDPEVEYLDKGMMESFKYGGETYAIPTNLQFSAVMVNLDLMEQLNMDAPEYDWTVEQFKDYLTRATTDKYSGINHLWGLDEIMAAMYSKNLSTSGYDPVSGKINMTDGSWVKGIALQKELYAIPGLVSDNLKNQKLRDEGKEDDYQKKFGKDADALREGKVLFGYHGTWDLGWISSMSYKYDMYPVPQTADGGYREALHSNNAYMMSTVKHPDAAFELLKWISYGKEGTLARIDFFKNKVDGEGKPAPEVVIPVSRDPEVVKAFETLDFVPGGIKYMYANMDKAFRFDIYKVVPEWEKAMNEVVSPKSNEIREGKVEAPSVAAELEQKVNTVLSEGRAAFEKQLADVQAKFPEVRKKAEGK